jgi:CelD/BcsL family acetyltransferase involved in cellulose biosynthesis
VDEKLTLEVVSGLGDLNRLKGAWDTLHATADPENPFNEWAWAFHWWRTFGRSKGLIRDELKVHVLCDRSGSVRAIVPFVLTSVGFGPLAVRKLRLFGAIPRNHLVELSRPLFAPGWERVGAATLVGRLVDGRARHHWCELDGLLVDSPLEQAIAVRAASIRSSLRPLESYYTLALPRTWDTFRATLKPHIKKNIRNSRAALTRDGHNWSFESVSHPAAIEEALDEFFELHRARAKAQRGPDHPDHFSSAASRAFLRSLASDLSEDGRFLICRLRVERQVVASRLVLVSGSSFYLYHSGLDPKWWRYSVGTTLVAECIKLAIDRGIRSVNLSSGTDLSKTRWGPQEHCVSGVRMIPSNLTSRVIASGHAITSRVVPNRDLGRSSTSGSPVTHIHLSNPI